ncbi:serine hydrolase [Ponticoccus sp. SC2-23]|nr:D-alanyl-D-alanine carboxypeptidase family protein [Alexandriicola marinus]MBM1220251.1 serine hydrolase [Ponticoccus sp. SC6-9]MBM1224937.1 serine hydrolase [Ponticoccus sp. SC6-15]MBM1228451.1 serine hydrolase [Ponticoccus sp. SC6-38]MBM1233912.1 serine hydrolase [Ponticoccus sp. SC6-45]MBM1238952.1 serine hydrolase [Ponticoccus sp. SC6-49]MBM1242734.1 serine hydrolase [Ponticoccus sp. SC2-64]MBM1247436.1 serine hydrolase [Ponticoccus sp. SC6-42]MBM1251905.1 serine hydrolase [Ponticocc
MMLAGALAPTAGWSAPFAAMVMDARTGEVLHSQNAETRLHPASLTKMMTLYIAFQAVSRGEIDLDTEVRITSAAAAEPPSKIGLRAGQSIRLRYLIRAAAVKSANDAATAIGIAISGSEEAFAARMNATARAMGMTQTNFINMHGLTESGHMSTARDMTILGRHMIYDFPQYYNLFSRRTADAGIATVRNTNRRFLDSYEGADGIKTGFTNAAGFNLVASAERNGVRIITTVFGGTSSANRNARVAELMDLGFREAPRRARVSAPDAPDAYVTQAPEIVVGNNIPRGPVARTIRVSGLVERALRPQSRPVATPSPELVASTTAAIDDALAMALAAPMEDPAPPEIPDATKFADATSVAAGADAAATEETVIAAATPLAPEVVEVTPPVRPAEIIMTAEAIAPAEAAPAPEPEVVTRVSTSGGRYWGVNVGRFPNRGEAERILIQVALAEPGALNGALRRVIQRSGGFDANFMGLTREDADMACRRLQARGTTCFMIGTDDS